MISLTPSWLHKASAFSVAVVGSAIAWPWQNVVSLHTAGAIVSGLGLLKLIVEYFPGTDVPK